MNPELTAPASPSQSPAAAPASRRPAWLSFDNRYLPPVFITFILLVGQLGFRPRFAEKLIVEVLAEVEIAIRDATRFDLLREFNLGDEFFFCFLVRIVNERQRWTRSRARGLVSQNQLRDRRFMREVIRDACFFERACHSGTDVLRCCGGALHRGSRVGLNRQPATVWRTTITWASKTRGSGPSSFSSGWPSRAQYS